MTSKQNVMTERAGDKPVRKVTAYGGANGVKLLYSSEQGLSHSSSKSLATRQQKHHGDKLFRIYGVRSRRDFSIKEEAKTMIAKQKLRLTMNSGDDLGNLALEERARLSLPTINRHQ